MEPCNRSGQLAVDQLRVRPLLLLSTSTNTNTTTTAPATHLQLSSAVGTFLVFLALFMLFFFLWLYSRYCVDGQTATRTERGRRLLMQLQRHGLRQQPPPSDQPCPPDPSTLLPAVAYSGKEQVCVICLSEFEAKEMVKVIPCCSHVFHPECIDRWLASHDSCPVCRQTEILDGGNSGNSDPDLSLPGVGSTPTADAQVTPRANT